MELRVYYVKRHLLPTPLYQIWDRRTDEPVNPLWFYLRREDAEARIERLPAGAWKLETAREQNDG